MKYSVKLLAKGIVELREKEAEDIEAVELVRGKIKNIIDKFGEATSEGGISWEEKTTIYDENLERNITIDEHPLDIIADEILKIFINFNNQQK